MIRIGTFFLLSGQILIFGTLDRIQKAMDKGEHEKAIELIIRGYEKEPDNPGVDYYHSELLFDKSYAGFDLDSARVVIEKAGKKFELADSDLVEELAEEGITTETIRLLHEQIRDSAFQRTLSDFSIGTAESFRKKFPKSIYDGILIRKIDSIEFDQASALNTEESFVKFIAANPESVYKTAADSILDDLRYSKIAFSGNLDANYSFIEKYPDSRHREKAEAFILKTSTASHTEKAYLDFIGFAKSRTLVKQAADLLFYLNGKQKYDFHPLKDSIEDILSVVSSELYPVIQNDLFGFFDRDGEMRIQHKYQETIDAYKCKLTNDDWIYVTNQDEGLILTKKGDIVLHSVDGYKSVNTDIGLVQKENNWYLYHKSGYQILDMSVEDAEVINHKWIKVKKEGKWGLFSFMGLPVAELIYDEISKIESFWVFERNDEIALTNEKSILEEIEDRGISLEFKFDDIELVDSNALIGFKGDRECLLDSTLNFRIPWGRHEIYPESSGWYLKSNLGYRLYSEFESDIIDQYYSYLESNRGWLALQTETDWILVPRTGNLEPSRGYDSIKLVNEFASLLFNGNDKQLLFTSGQSVRITDERILTFQNQSEVLSLSDDNQTTLFNRTGEKLVSDKFENAIFLNDSLLRVQKKGKQGLLHINGEWVLNPVFESIDEKDGLILTLIKGKIGCYDPSISKLLTTEYEARIERIKTNYLAKKDGKFGIIDSVKNEIISFDYDAIEYWNDSSYLVKRENQYLIIDDDEELLYAPFEDARPIVESEDHKMYRFVKNGKYGLLSNKYGELLSPDFTDIFNIGTLDNPLIFADQHLDKARFHVVSYISEMGKLVLSKAYTSEEFEKVLCDE